jgi:hypothetical protein
MAFKPSGGGGDGSNVYIYRAPTALAYRNPAASPSPSPPPAAAAGGGSSGGGLTRGPPSATDSKMIGGPQRDYVFPSKADYTPYGPKNAPYAQSGQCANSAAGQRCTRCLAASAYAFCL